MTAGRDPRDRLQALRLASERIASNLLDLEADDTVAMLDAADLCGITGDRWCDARVRRARLFTAHAAINDLVEQASRMVDGWRTPSAERLLELDSLLTGCSLVVSDTPLPAPERGLLGDSRRLVRRSADELIAQMSSDFDAVRSVVVGVCQVWDCVIPRLRCERQRQLALDALAGEIGIDRPELTSAATRLRGLSELALSDPLAVDVSRLDAIVAVFDQVEEEFAALQAIHTHWPDRVRDARDLLARTSSACTRCAEAVARASSRIRLDAPIEPVAVPAELVASLDAAVALGTEDRLSGAAALIGWTQATTNLMDEANVLTSRCEALIAERDDLRARLAAYVAKADRLGMLENVDASDLLARAHASLYTAPTDLGVAAELVSRYQQVLAVGGSA